MTWAHHTLLCGKCGRQKGHCVRYQALFAECYGESLGYVKASGVIWPQHAVGLSQCTAARRQGLSRRGCA